MNLDALFFLTFVLILVIQGIFNPIPLGNENSTVRRLPLITFAIISLNVLIFVATLPMISRQEEELNQKRTELLEFLETNPALLFDQSVRKKLVDEGIVPQEQWTALDVEMGRAKGMDEVYRDLIGEANAALLRADLDRRVIEFKVSMQSHFYYRYGLAPNGKWKFSQLITCQFLHGGWFHLIGNMLFFFAVGFSLEDLWGRGTFLGFYLAAGAVACIPSVFFPELQPMIGASGAISGAMGAFLVRLHKTRIKIGWFCLPLSIFGLIMMRRKPFGIVHIPAYVYMPFYFLSQILSWWFLHKTGQASGVAYSAHIAGFLFGVIFALSLKAAKIEEKYINPRIEGKISFSASPVVGEAFELMDKGDFVLAERKLQSHLQVLPNDVEALMALIQVYQSTANYEQINLLYARLIRFHLSKGDKEAALYAYDSLLSAFPEDQVNAKLPVRDWMMICEYIREMGMLREAAVEFERLANTCSTDALAIRACIEGGETALTAKDDALALRLFEKALTMNPTEVYQSRARMGIERSLTTGGHQRWEKQASQQGNLAEPTSQPKALN